MVTVTKETMIQPQITSTYTLPGKHIPLAHSECTNHLRSVEDALFVIGGKWKLRIIIALADGKLRFNELQRKITGISPKILSNELKELELNGFVRRLADANTPAIVEYETTGYSNTLHEVMMALSQWGRMHGRKIRQV
jgi:DNA-binding HxlR family transcriptional regulator